jgi:hypothetical protein
MNNITPIDEHDLNRTIARRIIAEMEDIGYERIVYHKLWEADIHHPKANSWRMPASQKRGQGWSWLGIIAFVVAAWILLEQPIAWFVAYLARHDGVH